MSEAFPQFSGDPGNNPRGFLNHLYDIAVCAARPGEKIKKHLQSISGHHALVVGAGKAAASMAQAAEQHLSCDVSGLVIVPDGYAARCERIDVAAAGHPLTDARGLQATTRIVNIVKAAGADDTVICLFSGGASALLAAPAAGVLPEEKRDIIAALMRSGARINELNSVRKHLSAVKGGRLADMAAPAKILTLAVSDVVGDDLATIGSGPSVPDPTTCDEARAVLRNYEVAVPKHIDRMFAAGVVETPKSSDINAAAHVVVRPEEVLVSAVAEVRQHGLNVHNLGDQCAGGAQQGAAYHAEIIRAIIQGHGPVAAPCVIISGGEYTVPVKGTGRGGPNTEFALSLALNLKSESDVWALAADTDGIDGTSGAAGAFVAPETLTRAGYLGRDAQKDLADNDSAGFFGALQDLVTPGPTLTNVNDFRAIYIGQSR